MLFSVMLYNIPVLFGREIAALIIRWLSYAESSTQRKRLKESKYKHLQLTVTHIYSNDRGSTNYKKRNRGWPY